jgi:phosphoserine phosphatase
MLEPVVFGSNKGRLIREYAEVRGWDLAKARAYADSASDQAMLQVVGRAGLVNPSPRLARVARDYGWQNLKLEGS